jgi:hypothetical protein
MLSLSRSLRGFRYDPARGRFRDYLGWIVRNAVIRWKSREMSGRTPLLVHTEESLSATPPRGETDEAWEREWMNHHFRLAMATIRQTFEAKTVEVFDRLTRGERAEALAAEYGMSPGAIYQLKNRIGNRLRAIIAEQVREEDDADAR